MASLCRFRAWALRIGLDVLHLINSGSNDMSRAEMAWKRRNKQASSDQREYTFASCRKQGVHLYMYRSAEFQQLAEPRLAAIAYQGALAFEFPSAFNSGTAVNCTLIISFSSRVLRQNHLMESPNIPHRSSRPPLAKDSPYTPPPAFWGPRWCLLQQRYQFNRSLRLQPAAISRRSAFEHYFSDAWPFSATVGRTNSE